MKDANSYRKKRAKLSVAVALLYQVVSAVVGLILPRYILVCFGSDVNGILQSISQLLSYAVVLECGIGGMVVAAFYKPLADGDNEAISDIFNSTKKFFTKISFVYIGLVAFIAVFAKLIINTEKDMLFVGTLVVILGINTYFNYYFGITHQLLIKADQRLYVVQSVQTVTLVCNAVICIAAMSICKDIHIIKLISAIVFLANPIVYRWFVKKNYKIDKKVFDENRTLPRKREGVIQHMSYFIHRNTDVVLLAMFAGAKEVSVYSVYNAVVMAAENFLGAISNALAGAIGNIIAKDEKDVLTESFEIYEAVNTFITSFFSTAAAVLIVPFAMIYTSGINDVNYARPIFAYLIIAAQWFYCVRIPYWNVITAAGHYKETIPGAYIEVFTNIGLSIPGVIFFGIDGVAFGTLMAMLARTVYNAWYLSKSILHRSFFKFVKTTVCNLMVSVATVFVLERYMEIATDNFIAWAIDACAVSVIVLAVFAGLNLVINNRLCILIFKKIVERKI